MGNRVYKLFYFSKNTINYEHNIHNDMSTCEFLSDVAGTFAVL